METSEPTQTVIKPDAKPKKRISIRSQSPPELRVRCALKYSHKYKAYMDYIRRNRDAATDANSLFTAAFHKFDGGNALKSWAKMNYPGWQATYGKFPGKVEEPPPPPPPPAAARRPEPEEEDAADGHGAGADDELELVERSVFAGKEQSEISEDIQWALEHVIIKDVEAKDAPSATAWLFLQDMRKDGNYRKKIIGTWTPRFLVDVQSIEARYKDDGKSELSRIRSLKNVRGI